MINKQPTIVGLVDEIHLAATGAGMDLAPTDTAFIIAMFLERLAAANSTPDSKVMDDWLKMIAAEVNKVKDEQ